MGRGMSCPSPSISVVTNLQADRSRSPDLFLSRAGHFSSPRRPDRLWGSQTSYIMGSVVSFPAIKVSRL